MLRAFPISAVILAAVCSGCSVIHPYGEYDAGPTLSVSDQQKDRDYDSCLHEAAEGECKFAPRGTDVMHCFNAQVPQCMTKKGYFAEINPTNAGLTNSPCVGCTLKITPEGRCGAVNVIGKFPDRLDYASYCKANHFELATSPEQLAKPTAAPQEKVVAH